MSSAPISPAALSLLREWLAGYPGPATRVPMFVVQALPGLVAALDEAEARLAELVTVVDEAFGPQSVQSPAQLLETLALQARMQRRALSDALTRTERAERELAALRSPECCKCGGAIESDPGPAFCTGCFVSGTDAQAWLDEQQMPERAL